MPEYTKEQIDEAKEWLLSGDEYDKEHATCILAALEAVQKERDALAEPEPDAIRILEKVRDTGDCWENQPAFVLPFSEAVALIESYGRRVPRVMLEEISDMGDPCLNDLRRERLDAIAAKHGVKVEDAK